MKKCAIKGVLVAALLFALPMPCQAASWVDDFNWQDTQTSIQYTNLTRLQGSFRVNFDWATAPDDTVYSVQNPAIPATASYRLPNGAKHLTVWLYSANGGFALGDTSDPSSLLYGMATPGAQSMPKSRLYISRQTGLVYTAPQEDTHVLTYSPKTMQYSFVPTTCSGGNFSYLGLSVQVSADGANYRSITPTLTDAIRSDPSINFGILAAVLEEYSLALPADVRYVRVIVEDYTGLPDTKNLSNILDTYGNYCLARVAFSGLGEESSGTSSQPSTSSGAGGHGGGDGPSWVKGEGTEQFTGGAAPSQGQSARGASTSPSSRADSGSRSASSAAAKSSQPGQSEHADTSQAEFEAPSPSYTPKPAPQNNWLVQGLVVLLAASGIAITFAVTKGFWPK